MGFQGRYEILEMLKDGEARTFKARQTSSGRIVLLHQLWAERTPPNQPDLASMVFAFLRRASAEDMRTLIDMGEEESRVFVVTQDVPGCQDLRQWLQSVPGMGQAAGKVSVPKSAPRSDFEATIATTSLGARDKQGNLAPSGTEVFVTPKVLADQKPSTSSGKPAGSPATHSKPQAMPGPPARPEKPAGRGGPSEAGALKGAQPPSATPPSKEMAEPGEFTRMFLGSPGASAAPPAAQSRPDSRKAGLSPPAATAPPKGKSEPGKFAQELAPAPEKPPQRQPPGAFEVVFDGRKQPGTPAPPAVEKPSPPRVPGGGKEPGEFTRAFYGRDALKAATRSPEPAAEKTPRPSLAPDKPVQSKGPGEFTRLFQAESVMEKPPATPSSEAGRTRPLAQPAQPAAQPPPCPPSPMDSEAPGEFTRLFQAGSQPARPAGPSIPAPLPRPAAPMPGSASRQGPGEFTQLIQGYQPPKSGSTSPALELPEPVAPPPPPAPAPDQTKPGEFTMIFQRPSELAATPPSTAVSRPVAQTPQAGSQSPEADEYMRMFELPSGGAGAPAQGPQQAPPPAAPQPAAGRGVPTTPMVSVSPPAVPSMPYVQPPAVPQPQPYQMPTPQIQQPGVTSPFATPAQPVMPPLQPMPVPGPAAPQAGPAKTGKSKLLVPVIILGGLFLIALVTILFFALKH